jgi:hypothetical protein
LDINLFISDPDPFCPLDPNGLPLTLTIPELYGLRPLKQFNKLVLPLPDGLFVILIFDFGDCVVRWLRETERQRQRQRERERERGREGTRMG